MYEVTEDMVVYAFRYALGRKTYAVQDVSDYLIENWHRFSKHTQSQIIDDIEKAIERGEAGMECDIKMWKAVLLLHNAVREEQS